MRPHPLLAFCVLAVAPAVGCVHLSKETAPVHHYMLSVTRPQRTEPGANAPLLAVERLEPAPAYSGKEFVYRTGEFAYETDYYNQFLEEPATAVSIAAQRWLADCGLFSHVVDGGAGVQAQYVLKGELLALYGDYRDAGAPQAVVDLRILLLDGAAIPGRVVLLRDYEETVAAGDGTPEALAAAWSQGVSRALQALTRDMAETLHGSS